MTQNIPDALHKNIQKNLQVLNNKKPPLPLHFGLKNSTATGSNQHENAGVAGGQKEALPKQQRDPNYHNSATDNPFANKKCLIKIGNPLRPIPSFQITKKTDSKKPPYYIPSKVSDKTRQPSQNETSERDEPCSPSFGRGKPDCKYFTKDPEQKSPIRHVTFAVTPDGPSYTFRREPEGQKIVNPKSILKKIHFPSSRHQKR